MWSSSGTNRKRPEFSGSLCEAGELLRQTVTVLLVYEAANRGCGRPAAGPLLKKRLDAAPTMLCQSERRKIHYKMGNGAQNIFGR